MMLKNDAPRAKAQGIYNIKMKNTMKSESAVARYLLLCSLLRFIRRLPYTLKLEDGDSSFGYSRSITPYM